MNLQLGLLFNVLDHAAAPARRTAAGSLSATTVRRQSLSRGGLRVWWTGLGTPRRSTSSSGGLRRGRRGSGRTRSAAR